MTLEKRWLPMRSGSASDDVELLERDLQESIELQKGCLGNGTELPSESEGEGDESSDFIIETSPVATEAGHLSYLVRMHVWTLGHSVMEPVSDRRQSCRTRLRRCRFLPARDAPRRRWPAAFARSRSPAAGRGHLPARRGLGWHPCG